VPVFDFLCSGKENPSFGAKLAEALGLLAVYHPRTLDRVRKFAVGLVLFDHTRVHGSWNAQTREIRLSPSTFRDLSAAELACTVAHEACHAWLSSIGFINRQERRHRVEAVCYRTEAAFARRLPDGRELSERYMTYASEAIEEGPEAYSLRARRERDLLALADLGAPTWLLGLLGRFVRRGSA